MRSLRQGTLVMAVCLEATCSLLGQSAADAAKQLGHPPYTAQFKLTQVQTLTDGTRISTEMTEISARDSRGRSFHSIRTEEGGGTARSALTRSSVHDPISNTDTNWNSRLRTANVVKLPPRDQHQGCWAVDSGDFRESRYEAPKPPATPGQGTGSSVSVSMGPAPANPPKIQDLGVTSIDGVEAHGRRIITTIPAGEVGNDQPLVRTVENWSSPALGLTLREMSDDPRTGVRTRELENLTLAEPDASLFEPPDGYQVKTQEMHAVPCAGPR